MKLYLTSAVAFALFCASTALSLAAQGDLLDVRDSSDAPIKIIFDTDIGGDIDDAFALALIHRFADEGVCELLGVSLTNPNAIAARFVGACNVLYGRPDVPIAVSANAKQTDDNYPAKILEQQNADGTPEFPVPKDFKTEEPVPMLRRLLANAKNGEVVIVQVGGSTNLAALLDSPPDNISPYTGRELAEKKVRLVSVMGGAFVIDETAKDDYTNYREWNIIVDVPAAQKLAKEWPGEIVFSGYEVGMRATMSATRLSNVDASPKAKFLYDAFKHWGEKNAPNEGVNHCRPTWDLTSVYYVVRPEADAGLYSLSEPLDVAFDDDGATICAPNPKGKRRAFLTDEAGRAKAVEAFVEICSRP